MDSPAYPQSARRFVDASAARIEFASMARVSQNAADSAIHSLTVRAYDAALDASTRGAVKVACRILREIPQAPHYDAIRHNTARGGK